MYYFLCRHLPPWLANLTMVLWLTLLGLIMYMCLGYDEAGFLYRNL